MIHVYAALAELADKVVYEQERRLQDLLRNDLGARRTLQYILSNKELTKAYSAAKSAHAGQYRWKGRGGPQAQPYIYHIIDVVRHLLDSGVEDTHTLTVAILHDTVEDEKLTFKQLKSLFGDKVADHVSKLTLTDEDKDKYYRKKIVNDSHKPIRDIKLADRISKLRFIHELRGGRDLDMRNQFIQKYDKLKKETERDYDHWHDVGTNKNLRDLYRFYMENPHSEAWF